MRDILFFVLGAIGGKLIEDNLPNMHYKNIYKFYQKTIQPILIVGYLGLLFIAIKFTKNAEQQKQLYTIYTTVLVVCVVAIVLEQKKTKIPLTKGSL